MKARVVIFSLVWCLASTVFIIATTASKFPPKHDTRCNEKTREKLYWDGGAWWCICDYQPTWQKHYGFVNRLFWTCSYSGKPPKATPPQQHGKSCTKPKSVETVKASGWSWECTCACTGVLCNKQTKWSCKQKNPI